jgi:predicted Zn-dependent protease
VTQEDAKRIFDRALSFVTADEATATIYESAEATTRIANSEITQNTAKSDEKFEIRVAFGNRVGSASVNSFDDETLQTAVQRAEALARVAAPDTEFVPCPPQHPMPEAPEPWDKAVVQCDPACRAEQVKEAIAAADAAKVSLAGSLSTRRFTSVLANTKGAFYRHAGTKVRFVCTAMTETSSGWAEGVSHRLNDVDTRALATRAAKKAVAGQNPTDVQPGDWTVVMEPPAVADLLVFLAMGLDAKAAIEGRSVFSGKEGTNLVAPAANLFSDPLHPTCRSTGFTSEGRSLRRVDWVKEGRLKTLCYNRYWSLEVGRPHTGSPTNFVMSGGDATEDDLIRQVDRGLLITRLWYIRYVDPMQLLLTGMTRDGLFLIENGEVTRGVKNMRFNESPIVMLSNIQALGRPKRSGNWMDIEAPGLVADNFTFTSGTSF